MCLLLIKLEMGKRSLRLKAEKGGEAAVKLEKEESSKDLMIIHYSFFAGIYRPLEVPVPGMILTWNKP